MSHPLWAGIADGSRFYFVHSYYVDTPEPALVAGTSRYPFGFTCAVARNNIFAVQFHPEKSQSAGLRLLANFVSWDGTFRDRRPTDRRCPLRAPDPILTPNRIEPV